MNKVVITVVSVFMYASSSFSFPWGAPPNPGKGKILDSIRDHGAAFEGVKKTFSPGCGEVNCSLNDNDNCSLTFEDFYADTEQYPRRYCKVRLEVNLPRGWSMAPKAVAIEGDYQVSETGYTWLETSFGLANGETVRFNNRATPFLAGGEALGSDAFLLTKNVNTRTFSPCGGVAVFEGEIILHAVKGSRDEFESEINITQQNNDTGHGAEWGWVYRKCEDPKDKANLAKKKYCQLAAVAVTTFKKDLGKLQKIAKKYQNRPRVPEIHKAIRYYGETARKIKAVKGELTKYCKGLRSRKPDSALNAAFRNLQLGNHQLRAAARNLKIRNTREINAAIQSFQVLRNRLK